MFEVRGLNLFFMIFCCVDVLRFVIRFFFKVLMFLDWILFFKRCLILLGGILLKYFDKLFFFIY